MTTDSGAVADEEHWAEHSVQLFDGPESLGRNVARYLHDGVRKGHSLLLIARAPHVHVIAGALLHHDIDLASLLKAGGVTALDADRTVRSFVRNGRPSADLFARAVGSVVRQLCETSAGVRIYGEMVEVLAEEGNFSGAAELESLWAALGRELNFTLLCGYSSAHFAAPDAGDSLHAICHHHIAVRRDHVDLLANWLLAGEPV